MALEVNTSNVTKFSNGFYMADEYLLELFREYGGRLVTIGSDAHVPEHVGGSFDGAVQAIKKAGFSEYCYFKKREPVFVKID